jgi:predicted nucleic acid-binding protein
VSLYLLDTPIVAGWVLGRKAWADLVRPWIARDEVATSVLVYGEVVEYFMGRSDFPDRLRDLHTLLETAYP